MYAGLSGKGVQFLEAMGVFRDELNVGTSYLLSKLDITPRSSVLALDPTPALNSVIVTVMKSVVGSWVGLDVLEGARDQLRLQFNEMLASLRTVKQGCEYYIQREDGLPLDQLNTLRGVLFGYVLKCKLAHDALEQVKVGLEGRKSDLVELQEEAHIVEV